MSPKIKGFFFYSSEEPRVHVHYKKDSKKVKIWLEPKIEIAKNNGFADHELNDIKKKLKEVQNEFRKKWKEHLQS